MVFKLKKGIVLAVVFAVLMASKTYAMEVYYEGAKYLLPDGPTEMRIGGENEVALRYEGKSGQSIISLKLIKNIPEWRCDAVQMMREIFEGGEHGCSSQEVVGMKKLLTQGRNTHVYERGEEKYYVSCGKGGCVAIRMAQGGDVQILMGNRAQKEDIERALGFGE